MLVYADETFFGQETAIDDLLGLLHMVAQRRHDMRASQSAVLAGIERCAVLQGIQGPNDPDYVHLLQAIMRASVYTTMPSNNTITALNAQQAIADLRRPGAIVVENSVNDGAFIRGVAFTFCERVVAALASGWIQFVHAGGTGQLQTMAITEADRFAHFPRVLVVRDSDSYLPDPNPLTDFVQSLAERRITCHVFIRREAENYLPYRVIMASASKKGTPKPSDVSTFLQCFKSWSDEKRSHYDFKKGFGQPPAVHHNQASLYDEADAVAGLAFGDTLLACFAKNYGTLNVKDYESLGEAVVPELRNLMKKVEDII